MCHLSKGGGGYLIRNRIRMVIRLFTPFLFTPGYLPSGFLPSKTPVAPRFLRDFSFFRGSITPLPLPLATPLVGGSILGGSIIGELSVGVSIIFGSELTETNNEPTLRVFTPKKNSHDFPFFRGRIHSPRSTLATPLYDRTCISILAVKRRSKKAHLKTDDTETIFPLGMFIRNYC